MGLLTTLPPRDLVHAAAAREPASATGADLAARRERASLLPELVLRFTYANASAVTQLGAIDSPIDTWNWPVARGATLELRALWTFDHAARRVAPP